MLCYDFKKIELKWQSYWETNKKFKTSDDFSKKKFYCLDMFPYPSSEGLHVGHIEGYTASDIISRFKRMQGYNVLHPFGWDSFGLPAEQYALQTGNNPNSFVQKNIAKFKQQIKKLGKSIDWEKELSTSKPYFYKWTQWIFKKLYEKKLAFLTYSEVNFCEALGTVLANEEVISIEGGLVSERGHYPVVKKKMKQWILKITSYIEQLLEDLDLLDWPSQIKDVQKNWIGKKEGFIFNFFLENTKSKSLLIFTTKPNTIFGVNSLILAPEHYLVKELTLETNSKEVEEYIKRINQKTNLERIINKEKKGVFTGSYAIHPFSSKKIPIWIADYVSPYYGTGAIMSVPFCNEKDFLFSSNYNLKIIPILKLPFLKEKKKNILSEIQNNESLLSENNENFVFINSCFLDGLNNKEAHEKITQLSKDKKIGYNHNTYQIHDWVFSRQRYWGEPFPVYFDENNNIFLEKDENLPLELPFLDKIESSGDGTSPLSKIISWLYFEKDGKTFRRDTNTMPQLAGSSWYYIGYILKNHLGIIPLDTDEAKKKLDYFLPVDLYIGGAEHAVGHLLYSRFWHKFLYDLGLTSCKEPFLKLFNQGMILGKDNLKMSKSRNNGVNASEILDEYGADVIRLYIMFLGPLEDNKVWSKNGIKGIQRFLNRIYNICDLYLEKYNFFSSEIEFLLNKTIQIVTEGYEKLRFNKVISNLMIFINTVYKLKKINKEQMIIFLQLLNPLAPHLTEELNQEFLKNKKALVDLFWPFYKEKFLNTIRYSDLIVQINGKIKTIINIKKDELKDIIFQQVIANPKVKLLLKDHKIKKIIYIENKLLNLVI
ncbi:leucine--tRNA ligase [Candidatus Phytoplasma pini]|uniref:Leucine--tRNA ligase n=1 Tax=Candidatus Phytoplasma pini TaxID=267362 RepID=A0A559KJQ3_9MOLU|nr:leucine--tRNA ligase [Candidatus Phytoplasma pini]TVY12364.1 Leucyl-tRNA synthetase [Candidatus Phytoplasma pini]